MYQRMVKIGQPSIQANERNHHNLSVRENPIFLMLNLTITTDLSAANVDIKGVLLRVRVDRVTVHGLATARV